MTETVKTESEKRRMIESKGTMKVLVVYDSTYGNTEKIARAIGNAMEGETRIAHANDANLKDLGSFEMLVVGSPTLGGRATPAIQDYINKMPEGALKGVKVASFDTRLPSRWVGVFGYAADKIAGTLEAKGGSPVSPPQAFIVTGKKGPLRDGELERAANWAKGILH